MISGSFQQHFLQCGVVLYPLVATDHFIRLDLLITSMRTLGAASRAIVKGYMLQSTSASTALLALLLYFRMS